MRNIHPVLQDGSGSETNMHVCTACTASAPHSRALLTLQVHAPLIAICSLRSGHEVTSFLFFPMLVISGSDIEGDRFAGWL